MFEKDKEKKEEAIKLGKQILREKDLTFTATYKGEVFTMRFPMPYQRAQIEADIASRLAGQARGAYPEEHLVLLEATAYVNALVIPDKSPSWFTSAWTCYDSDLIGTLYSAYLSFRQEFQEKLRTDRFSEGN